MNRRGFLGRSALGTLVAGGWGRLLHARESEIGQSRPVRDPLTEPHFPDRLHLFVWRNWELANTERMAKVVGTTPDRILKIGAGMGLPPKLHLSDDPLRRIYITVIRQNWHVLPDEQLMQLLGWDTKRYEYTLKEDDFLWIKLGMAKPACPPVRYEEPMAATRELAAEIKHRVHASFGASMHETGEPPFQFVSDLSSMDTAYDRSAANGQANLSPARLDPRYVYSYFALYGDPLMEPDIDPFPQGFLQKLARAGINGVWLQAVLRTLAPSAIFSEFGEGWERRLQNLSALVERAQEFGIKVFLYLNEPRSMPADFFSKYPEMKGTYDEGDPTHFALCTSSPEVRRWIAESLTHIFSRVPALGGVFAITASENLTNCYSHGRAQFCPRCSKRPGAEVVAEVIQTFRDGVRRASAEARVIAWDWGWGNDWVPNGADADQVIERLPVDVELLSVSEWDLPINRGGFASKVNEYSISAVGPGPRARRHWEKARRRGLATLAKVQFSNSWEISAVPYVPVPQLIANHSENLLNAGVQGLMASWTVGGYPSPNMEVARAYYFSPTPAAGEVLQQVAQRRYGPEAAPAIVDAWRIFSQAFQEFPFGLGIYNIPTQHGPANPLRLRPTGWKSSMILFPHDDYRAWAGPYPVDTVEQQFQKMADLWKPGLDRFREALSSVAPVKKPVAEKDFGIAETCWLHFQSVANQIRFYQLRDQLESASAAQRRAVALGMIEIAESEMSLARRLYTLARRDSRIGYEASNHYYYRPLDLVEKVLNCQEVIDTLKRT